MINDKKQELKFNGKKGKQIKIRNFEKNKEERSKKRKKKENIKIQ